MAKSQVTSSAVESFLLTVGGASKKSEVIEYFVGLGIPCTHYNVNGACWDKKNGNIVIVGDWICTKSHEKRVSDMVSLQNKEDEEKEKEAKEAKSPKKVKEPKAPKEPKAKSKKEAEVQIQVQEPSEVPAQTSTPLVSLTQESETETGMEMEPETETETETEPVPVPVRSQKPAVSSSMVSTLVAAAKAPEKPKTKGQPFRSVLSNTPSTTPVRVSNTSYTSSGTGLDNNSVMLHDGSETRIPNNFIECGEGDKLCLRHIEYDLYIHFTEDGQFRSEYRNKGTNYLANESSKGVKESVGLLIETIETDYYGQSESDSPEVDSILNFLSKIKRKL